MRYVVALAAALFAVPCFADALILSGTGAGADVYSEFINPNTFYFQFFEQVHGIPFWEAPAVAEGSTDDTIPVPYPDRQGWTITSVNAIDFGLDWAAMEAAFADRQELSLRFGMGIHPGLGTPWGQAWSTIGLGLEHGAFTRQNVVRDGVMIQSQFRDSPDWPGWSLVTLDVESIQFERYFYDWETCNGKWCFGQPRPGLLSHVIWTITGEGELVENPPPPVEPIIPEASVMVLLLSLAGCLAVRRGPRDACP